MTETHFFTFCGMPLQVVTFSEPEVPDTFECPGHPATFGIEEIIMPDGDRCGTEYFNESTLNWITGEVRKKLESEADSTLEDRAVERHLDTQWSHGRRVHP